MPRVRIRSICLTGFVAGLLFLSGCALGPMTIRTNRLRYNEAVRQTWNEEFLLNIVRTRYREPIQFDAVTSVTAQHEFSATGNASEDLHTPADFRILLGALAKGTVPAAGPSFGNLFNILHYGGTAGMVERPTISYNPLEGADFVRSLLSPIHLETIAILNTGGWDVDRILRLTVHEMNHLPYVPEVTGAPERVPSVEPFMAAVKRLRALQERGLLEFAYDDFDRPVSETWEIGSELKTADLLNAAEKRYDFHRVGEVKEGDKERKDKILIALNKKDHVPVMRIAPQAWRLDPAAPELAELLKLLPGQPNYRLVSGAELGQFKRLEEPGAELVLTTRSTLGALIFAAKGVEVPAKHLEEGLVPVALDENGQPVDWSGITGDLIQIHSQKVRPLHAYVAVKYRGYWFYIDDNDLNSKSTFALVITVMGMELAGGIVPGPVLTVPVGGGLQQTIPGAAGGGGGGGGGGKKGG